ncbi:MAG: ABC transporter ATP-binding protein [Paracoccaceae bacterium]
MIRFSELISAFAPADGPPPATLAAFMRWALKGSWRIVVLAACANALAGIMEAGNAFIVGWVIDGALLAGPQTYFAENWPWLAGIVVFFLLIRPSILGLTAVMNSVTLGPNLSQLVLGRVHRHTLGQSVGFFDDDFAGRIAQKEMQTSRAATEVVLEVVNVVTFAFSTLIGAAVLMATIDWRLLIVLAVWLFLYFVVISWFLPRIRLRAKARAAARAAVTGQIVDTVTNIKTVKLFAHAGHEDAAAVRAMATYRETQLDFGRLASLFRFVLMATGGLLPVLLIGGALWIWRGGMASAGDIAMAGLISTRIAQMTGWVSFTALGIFANVGEVEDGVRTLSPAHGITDAPVAREIATTRGDVVFDNVRFTYGRENGGGLDGFSLHVRPGEKVGLVGASGAGKSTAVALLQRLYDVEGGKILLDGRDIRELTQDSLRRQIGMVTQETAMFNRSARENILYGRPDADEAEMLAAATLAEAHGFILELRDFAGRKGYEAFLGERGVKLSGGQRQRIALARAILKDAPVLVLDEATSALDSEVEASIQTALESVMAGKTVIAIAHRLSTIARMDRIVVMEEGRIVEEGTHDSLLARGGLYARFWRRQSGGFIGLSAAE